MGKTRAGPKVVFSRSWGVISKAIIAPNTKKSHFYVYIFTHEGRLDWTYGYSSLAKAKRQLQSCKPVRNKLFRTA